jgi:thiamine pyrophosphokinase
MASEVVFVVVNGGDPPHPAVVEHLTGGACVIAADGGADCALALGLVPHLVVGDLDSVTPEGLARAEALGAAVERHPTDKNAVDFELAIDAAVARGATRITVVSGGGDRLDHWLGALHVLGRPDLAAVAIDAWFGPAHVHVVHGTNPEQFEGSGTGAPRSSNSSRRWAVREGVAGTIVSLLPLHGPARGVTTSGLRYPLHGEDLAAATSRGVSNELLGGPASVRLDEGCLLVVVPFALEVTR